MTAMTMMDRTTFPLVAEPVKVATLNAFRDVERGLMK